MPAKRWGDYEILTDQVIGRGGMGTVYRGRQVSVNRPVAIKVLRRELTDNSEFVQRFHREAALLARLVDAHVVQIYGAGTADGDHFYAMEFVEGEDLGSMLKRGRTFEPKEVLKIALYASKALQAAWRQKIVHRDIKPSNLIVTAEGRVKVMDFGLAKNPETDLTVTELVVGTAKYMSPEQGAGAPCDIRSDLYSLGVVLYELATGVPPFTGDNVAQLIYQQVHQHPRAPRELNPRIPKAVEAVILRLMAKRPEDRYATPDELLADVRNILEGAKPRPSTIQYAETVKNAQAPPPEVPTVVAPAPRRGSAGPVVAALLFIVAGGVAAWRFGYLDRLLASRPAEPPPVAAKPPSPPMETAKPAEVPPAPVNPPAPAEVQPPAPVEKPPAPVEKPAEPPKPEPPAWEEARRRGMEAFRAGKWAEAIGALGTAKELGAPGLDAEIREARGRDLLERGDAEKDPVRAIEIYERAKAFIDNAEVQARIERAHFRRWAAEARSQEGKDWAKAAGHWDRAREHAQEVDEIGEAEGGRKFARAFAEGLRARVAREWDKALAAFKSLAKEPGAWARQIEEEIRAAEAGIAEAKAAGMEKVRRELLELVAAGRAAHARGDWAAARTAFRSALDARFSGIAVEDFAGPLREAEAALAAPAGMVYVRPGRFRMGGGRAVEPEGEAEAKGFYMDLREATVAEYRAFLLAGHHDGCPKDEPSGKPHEPDRWADQKDADPVTGVDWWDAASYAAWRKRRLPTEVEWERAAGYAPAGRRLYPWGDAPSREGGRSFLGLEGMGGGAFEWTADWFQPYPWGAASNPDFGQRKKVLRGGVLLVEDADENAKVTYRQWYLPGYRARWTGLRCAMDLP
jgi:serine/threonine-protein kinase